MNIIDKVWLVVKMVAFNSPDYVIYISLGIIFLGLLVIVYVIRKQKKKRVKPKDKALVH